MMKEILDGLTLKRTLTRIVYEIIEKGYDLDNTVLIGIKTRGVFIANRLASRLNQLENKNIPVGELDISSFRDDAEKVTGVEAITNVTDLTGKEVILVDDVLFTGRSIRAAMDAVVSYGRPKCIALAVLIDRGHREYPIRADYIGKNIPTSLDEKIIVRMSEIDSEDKILIEK